jgi:hypothetical protein
MGQIGGYIDAVLFTEVDEVSLCLALRSKKVNVYFYVPSAVFITSSA